MVDSRLGHRIQHFREKAGKSQEELARFLGISVTSVSNIERGANYPSFENFIKIINYLGVSPNAVMLDVADEPQISRAAGLWEKMKKLDADKRNQIFKVIEVLLEN